MASDGGEADQNLLTALISGTRIFEQDGDATWSHSPDLSCDGSGDNQRALGSKPDCKRPEKMAK